MPEEKLAVQDDLEATNELELQTYECMASEIGGGFLSENFFENRYVETQIVEEVRNGSRLIKMKLLTF